MKRELHFYLAMACIFILALFIRATIFGLNGMFVSQGASLGMNIDSSIIALSNEYLFFAQLVNPYGVVIVIALLTQAFVMSISACLAFIYPDLRDIHSRAHLQGQELMSWYKKHDINPLVIMITPMFRIAILIAVMMVFIRPLGDVNDFLPSATEYVIFMFLYFSAILPHIFLSNTPIWNDSAVIVHIIVGVFCLIFVPYAVFVYFTVAALFQTGKVIALHLMESSHEANPQTTH